MEIRFFFRTQNTKLIIISGKGTTNEVLLLSPRPVLTVSYKLLWLYQWMARQVVLVSKNSYQYYQYCFKISFSFSLKLPIWYILVVFTFWVFSSVSLWVLDILSDIVHSCYPGNVYSLSSWDSLHLSLNWIPSFPDLGFPPSFWWSIFSFNCLRLCESISGYNQRKPESKQIYTKVFISRSWLILIVGAG